jgi:hypothetical protein
MHEQSIFGLGLVVESIKAAETTDKALLPLTLSSAATPPVIVEAS